MKKLQQIRKFFWERKTLSTYLAVGVILLVMFLVAFFSSHGAFGDPGDSGTVDEVAHIPSGYTYVKDQDYRLNPEHPPLVKALAGFSLVLRGVNGPESNWSWAGINQWESGWFMIYNAGNNPQTVLSWARFPMILLMLALGFILFKWAREVFGTKVGLLILALYAFYPDVLAHGRLVTTDVPAALGYVLAIYFFDRALRQKSWPNILFAAAAFAAAQLLKFSAFLLFIIFLILVVVRAILDRKEDGGFWQSLWKNFKPYFWICFISVILVWIVYVPFVWNTPPAIEHQLIETNLTNDSHTLFYRNFIHLFENNPILRGLGHYFLGILLVIARVQGGNSTFILGQLSDKSISWYFPVAWLLKTSIPVILLLLSSLVMVIVKWPAEKKYKWALALFLTPLAVYWGFTLKGQLNIGIRHLMPTVPFVLLLIGFALKPVLESKKKWLWGAVAALFIYFIGSTLANYPNFIAYFNEFTPKDQRYQRLTDSSLDWGQDLLRLKKYIDDNKIKSIKLDYFGGSVPAYYIPEAVNWHSSYGPTTGWLAVSATFYQSSKLYGPMEGKWSYSWLDNIKPKAIIGGSILVYNITNDDWRVHPPVSPYKIKVLEHPQVPATNPLFKEQK